MSKQTFRSPVSKLLSFFHDSRDDWKAKCKAAKKEVKSLKVRLAKMKTSRDRWKHKARQPLQAPEGTDPSAVKSPAARIARRCQVASAAGGAG